MINLRDEKFIKEFGFHLSKIRLSKKNSKEALSNDSVVFVGTNNQNLKSKNIYYILYHKIGCYTNIILFYIVIVYSWIFFK